MKNRSLFVTDLAEVINKHSLENMSNTPDIIIAEHLCQCLDAWNAAIILRNDWYYGSNGTVINPMEPNSHQIQE